MCFYVSFADNFNGKCHIWCIELLTLPRRTYTRLLSILPNSHQNGLNYLSKQSILNVCSELIIISSYPPRKSISFLLYTFYLYHRISNALNFLSIFNDSITFCSSHSKFKQMLNNIHVYKHFLIHFKTLYQVQ